jgi:cytidylate kinase
LPAGKVSGSIFCGSAKSGRLTGNYCGLKHITAGDILRKLKIT